MQVFEFHFNPRLRRDSGGLAKVELDLILDSFCYEPKNIYEKRVGNLYLVGLLKNVLPQNFRFLDRLAETLKEKYYSPTLHSPEKSLKESLKKGNEFLENIAKNGDVSWLGNLSFAALSLAPHQKSGEKELNFTKVGDLKIFLLRDGQIIDIDQKLKFQEIEPYPLKIFSNIISGKLAENDIILALTKEAVSAFTEDYNGSPAVRQKLNKGGNFFPSGSLMNEIAKITPFEEKKLREIFKARQAKLSKISGVCLLIVLSKDILPKKEIIFREKIAEFSIWQIFRPAAKKAKESLKFLTARFPPINFKQRGEKIKISENLKRNLVLILALIFFLVLGLLLFH